MPWSFGIFVVLVCLLIVLACLTVRILFKPGLGLRAVRVHSAGGRPTVIVRTPVATKGEAQRSADATGLPRALMGTGGLSPSVVLV